MKTILKKALTGLFSLFLLSPAQLTAQSARDIMETYIKTSKEPTSVVEQMRLSSSRYTLQNGSMRIAEKPRISSIEVISKNYGKTNEDSRSVSRIIEPVRDKGISMLSYTYGGAKDDETWLYLPVLGKVKRMISTSKDTDESGSFFGSEFSVEDINTYKIQDYTYKILEEGEYLKRPVWILELMPTPARSKISKYGKIKLWIDKERYVVVRQDLFNHNGILFKRLTTSNIEEINGFWVARKAQMDNLVTRRVTVMELLSIAYNLELPDELLTQRSLTDFAFVERNMDQLREKLK